LSEKFRRSKVNENVLNGVEVKRVAHLQNNVRKVYEPDHPAARIAGTEDAGYVYYPKISVAQELADLRMAAASYEANLAVLDTSKQMMERALSIGKRG
jgi:flagellar basal-body rod protein FlgC